jgi:hypothetical protein
MSQLVGVGDGLGGCAAVLAGQIAGLRNLPDGQKGRLIEVQPAASWDIVHRLHIRPPAESRLTGPEAGPAPGNERFTQLLKNSKALPIR